VASDAWLGWILVAGMAAIVFFTRAVFVMAGSRFRLPPAAERVLRYAPAAALMAIVVPDLALTQGALAISFENPRFLAGLGAFAIAVATRNVMLTIVGGMVALTAIRVLGG
jgi:branched-subunit amino acid transport protein